MTATHSIPHLPPEQKQRPDLSKPKSGLAKYLSELRYRIIWNREARTSSAAAKAAFEGQSEISLQDVKAFLRHMEPQHAGQDLVRIGPDEDGGYLLRDDLVGGDAHFSPGVSETLGVDLEIAERGIDCFLADASVSEPKGLTPNMRFIQKFIGPKDAGNFMTTRSSSRKNHRHISARMILPRREHICRRAKVFVHNRNAHTLGRLWHGKNCPQETDDTIFECSA